MKTVTFEIENRISAMNMHHLLKIFKDDYEVLALFSASFNPKFEQF